MVAEFSGLMESSAFLLRNFREEFQNLKNMRALKLGEGGLIKIEIEKKNQKKPRENYYEKKNCICTSCYGTPCPYCNCMSR